MTDTIPDSEAATRTLVAAFADDPVARWLLPHDPRSCAERVFRPAVELSAAHGGLAVTADGAGVAVWLPRGAEAPASELESIPDDLARLRTFLGLTEGRHPVGRAHRYLVFLGVRPEARGHGIGATLLRDGLARADAAGLPSYLEASSPRNLPLYRRHGFRTTGDPIALPDGPSLAPMWREPRP